MSGTSTSAIELKQKQPSQISQSRHVLADGEVFTPFSGSTLMTVMNQSAVRCRWGFKDKYKQLLQKWWPPGRQHVGEQDKRRRSPVLSYSLPFACTPFYVSNTASFNHFDFEHWPLMAPRGLLHQRSRQTSPHCDGDWYSFNRKSVAHISHVAMEKWWKAASGETIKRMRETSV